MLKSEYSYLNENSYYEAEDQMTSPMLFRSPSSAVSHGNETGHDTSLPPMAKLPTRTLFEEVCQAVQQQNNVPHNESSPANLNLHQPHNEAYSTPMMSPCLPYVQEHPRAGRNSFDVDNVGLPPMLYPDQYTNNGNSYQDNRFRPNPRMPEYVAPPPYVEKYTPPPEESFRQKQPMKNSSPVIAAKEIENSHMEEFPPNPPPRKKSFNLKNSGHQEKTGRSKSVDSALDQISGKSDKEVIFHFFNVIFCVEVAVRGFTEFSSNRTCLGRLRKIRIMCSAR